MSLVPSRNEVQKGSDSALLNSQSIGVHGRTPIDDDAVTGLSDYGFRDYSPTHARFITEDSIRDGENWFAYVGNNPVNFIDPWGLMPTAIIGGGVGAIAGGITGGISAIVQGKDIRGVVGGIIGGAISGAVTGAILGSGAGLIAVAGGSFIGGALGSVTETLITNKGIKNLDAKKIVQDALTDGSISAVATVTIGSVGKTATSAVHNRVWETAQKVTTAMDGSWGTAARNAIKRDNVVSVVKPIVENGINTAVDIAQDMIVPKVQEEAKDGGNTCKH